jgi:hypothetical protein
LSDGVVIAMKSASGLFFGGIYRKFLAIANELARESCPQFLSLRTNLPTVLARGSCHCAPPQRGEVISSQATLVFGLLRYARNDKNQDGHEAQGLSR